MKLLNNLKKLILFTLLTLFLESCEKSEINSEVINDADKPNLENVSSTAKEPLLHMHFDANLSEEQALMLFDIAAKEFITNRRNKGSNNEFFYTLSTYTGKGKNDGTDARVEANIGFDTNRGRYPTYPFKLDNPGNDREGGWDVYLLSYETSSFINWVGIRAAQISLRGTDGWRLKKVVISIPAHLQIVSAFGGSTLVWYPENSWLDGSCSSCWDRDFIYTNVSETGKLQF